METSEGQERLGSGPGGGVGGGPESGVGGDAGNSGHTGRDSGGSAGAAEGVSAPGRLPDDPDLPGPFPVGEWARGFKGFLRGRPRVLLRGEVCNYSGLRSKAVYFDIRDEQGAAPCAMWRSDLDKLDLPADTLRDGVEVVVAGGPDYYEGSERSSPAFSFRVSYLRPAGEGDLLAQLERLRRRLASEGLLEPQKRLPRPALPRTVGVVVGSDSAAFGDILAGLERRSWRGRLVCAHPPVQGKGAAPRISAAIRELAAIPEVETIVVARGGGSLTDLWCFCDETLCRTVAMLRVPVISAVGHDYDRTLIDEVAAVACSTPTHAAEAAVRLDVATQRADLAVAGAGLGRLGRRAVAERARGLGAHARGLAGHMRSERAALHQKLREIRAASGRALERRGREVGRFGIVLGRRRKAELHDARAGDLRKRVESLAATIAAHDPDRVLERGYAIVTEGRAAGDAGESGEARVITTAADARAAGRLGVRFADDHVEAEVIDDD